MKTIIFTRVSTEAQHLESQQEQLISLAEKLGYIKENQILIGEKESAISLSVDERESINRLKETILSDSEINCLVCWELSRIGRRADVIYNVRDFLLEHHIRWIVNNPYMEIIDSSSCITPAANLMLSIFTAFCENEMTIKQERMVRGKRARVASGHYIGGKILYGYAIDENKCFVLDPVDSENVRKIFTMYSTGQWSLRALGDEFRDRGAFHTVRRRSTLTKVSTILNDRRYIGENPHFPAIISEDLFNKCMEVKNKNQKIQRPTNKAQFLGKGILRTKDQDYLLSCCHTKRLYINQTGDSMYFCINQEYMDKAVWDVAKFLYEKYVSNPEVRQKKMLVEAKQLYFKMKNADDDVKSVQEKIDRLEERIILGSISKDKAENISNKLSEDLKEAKSKYTKWYNLYGQKMEQMHTDYWQGTPQMLDELSFEEKRNIVFQVIDKIYVSRPFPRSYRFILEVHTKFGDEFTKECRGRF